MITVLLADDHAIIRDGLRLLLESQPDIRVIGEAAHGRIAVSLVQQLKPAVAILDIAMPELNGIEAARQMRLCCPTVALVILSMHASHEHIYRAVQAGVLGYLLKESAGQELIKAVRAVAAGQRYLSQSLDLLEINEFIRQRNHTAPLDPLQTLSSRELEVLQLVVEGKTSQEIASRLFLSVKTVETYRSRLMTKLGLADLPALVRFAIHHGLISVD